MLTRHLKKNIKKFDENIKKKFVKINALLVLSKKI